MDLLARKRLRNKQREIERLKKLQQEEIFKKPQQPYAPSTKKATIILLVLVAAFIVYLFLTNKVIVSNECGLMPGIECTDLQIVGDTISFTVHNYLKEDLNITLQPEGCSEKISNYIHPNTKAEYTFNCASDEDVVRKKISMTYVGYSGLPHDKTGALVGKR